MKFLGKSYILYPKYYLYSEVDLTDKGVDDRKYPKFMYEDTKDSSSSNRYIFRDPESKFRN